MYSLIFSTFALGNTSTKFVAEYLQKDISSVKTIIRTTLTIVASFSFLMCLLLFLYAQQIADFVDAPQLATSFKFLGVIIVFRALNTVGAGILGGFKDFKRLGINNVIAGVTMIVLCVPLTKMYGLYGSYISLLLSQVCLCFLNVFWVYRKQKMIEAYSNNNFGWLLLSFSFPFALNEFVYTFTTWGGSLAMTKFASLGDLGMYTACMQWNSVILFVPGLLGNVILSYLSSSAADNPQTHHNLINKMLLINFVSTLIPMFVVAIMSKHIADYYGSSFAGLNIIMLVAIWETLFTCLSRVFESNLMSEGKKWTAFMISSSLYLLLFIATIIILIVSDGKNAAMYMVQLCVIKSILSFLIYSVEYRFSVTRVSKI